MTLSLKPETEMAIASRVESGRYSTPDEVVLEALRLLWERDRAEDERRLQELRSKIAIGTELAPVGWVEVRNPTLMSNHLDLILEDISSTTEPT